MTNAILTVLATAAISYFITRASILDNPRAWIELRSKPLGKLLTCTYCTAHWVAAALVIPYGTRFWEVFWITDYLITVAITAFLASLVAAVFDWLTGED